MRSDCISGIIRWYSVQVSPKKVNHIAIVKGICLKTEVFINFSNFHINVYHTRILAWLTQMFAETAFIVFMYGDFS